MLGIFGAGRNGSTLLMRLLDGSPGLWVYPIELDVLALLGEGPRAFERWVDGELRELGAGYLDRLDEPVDRLPEVRVDDRASGAENLLAYLDAVRAAYGRGDEQHAFKTIEVADIDRWITLFPSLRLLHIFREPVANYASLKRTDMIVKSKPFWFQEGDTLRTFVERRWAPHAAYALKHAGREPDRHRIVRYEDVTADPAGVIGGICEWLGVAPPADPELQTVLGGRRMRELPTRTSAGGAPPERVVAPHGDGGDVVSARERSWLAYRLGPLAGRLGYDLGRAPARAALAAQWLLPDRWELMNARPRTRLAKRLLVRRAYLARELVR